MEQNNRTHSLCSASVFTPSLSTVCLPPVVVWSTHTMPPHPITPPSLPSYPTSTLPTSHTVPICRLSPAGCGLIHRCSLLPFHPSTFHTQHYPYPLPPYSTSTLLHLSPTSHTLPVCCLSPAGHGLIHRCSLLPIPPSHPLPPHLTPPPPTSHTVPVCCLSH